MRLTHLARALALALSVGCCATALGQAALFNEGQKVEVREGDSWSAATVVKKEGRRYLIHYEGADASADEWVTMERIRTAGAGATTPAVPATPTTTATAATPAAKPKPKPVAWVTGQTVEVKRGMSWDAAKIINRRGEWYLVEQGRFARREWVEPWRIRKVGSTEDSVGMCMPNFSVRNNEGPPTEKPGDPPAPFGHASMDEKKPAEALKADPAFKEADASGVAPIQLVAPAGGKLVPDAAAPAASQLALRSIQLKGTGTAAFDGIKGIAIPRAKPTWAYVCHVLGMRSETVRLERLDLASGSSALVWDVSANTVLADVAPDGKAAMFRSEEFGMRVPARVEIWSLEGAAANKTLTFTPYAGERMANDITWGAFLDNGRIFTLNRNGALVLWDIAAAKAIYRCNLNPGSEPALSANAKYLAVNSGQQAFVIDPLTGKPLAGLPLDAAAGAKFAFSPSGKQLGAWCDGALFTWDLTTGKLISEFSPPAGVYGSQLAMPADGYLLLGGCLLDVEHRAALWSYRTGMRPMGATGTVAPGGQYCYAIPGPFADGGGFSMVKLPHADALAAVQALQPAEELLLLKPGVKVSLSVNLPEEQDKVTETLKKRIAESGLVLADNQPIVFRAFVEAGKTETKEYGSMHGSPSGPTEKVTTTSTTCKLTLEADGVVAWVVSATSGAGSTIWRKEGQSMQDAANEAAKPNTRFLQSVRLPKYLVKPHDPAWYGVSSLTNQGLRAGQ